MTPTFSAPFAEEPPCEAPPPLELDPPEPLLELPHAASASVSAKAQDAAGKRRIGLAITSTLSSVERRRPL
jgi:hypothetical protein